MQAVIGIHFGHDSSAVVLINGDIKLAIQEERFSRVKNHTGFPILTLKYIKEFLDKNHIYEIDVAVGSAKYTEEEDVEIALAISKLYKYKYNRVNDIIIKLFSLIYRKTISPLFNSENIWRILMKRRVSKLLKRKIKKIHFYDHHLCHAASACFSSGYKECLVITQDGKGDHLSGSVWEYSNENLLNIYRQSDKNSLGQMYAEITRFLGFKPNRHEGKITGLAATGNPIKFIQAFDNLIKVNKKGDLIRHDLNPLSENKSYFKSANLLQEYFKENLNQDDRSDIAAALQLCTEKTIISHVNIFSAGKNLNIALAGGLFANVKVNQEIRNIDSCSSLYIQPAMGDSGLALGAAQLLSKSNGESPKAQQSSLLGTSYDKDEIDYYLNNDKQVKYQYLGEKVYRDIANNIYSGRIIGLLQGRMEWGPRALGSRSILANTANNEVNQELNKRLKRSDFMPFAPIVIDYDMPELFLDWSENDIASKYMTSTYNVNPKYNEAIQAVVHVDGTARPQSISKDSYNYIYNVLTYLKELSGLGIAINTSFNIHEEPIVESPKDALRALKLEAIDVLYLENFKVQLK
tara:strand:- start:32680 stop:34410 length:1731 start_codon:yes stop_codon:yes gene_type:complete